MTLVAGTVKHLGADTLASAIDAAFAAELRDAKNQPLPPIAKEDRQLLFAAIAQGVLAYLARHDGEIKVNIDTGAGSTLRAVDVPAPTLTVSGSTVTGSGWSAGVTLTWAGSGATVSAGAVSGGAFSVNVSPPAGGDVLGARDGSGNAAAVRVG
ncbi:MAG: hypothetical protein QOF37_3021 [Thermoleophilaceae bacterium]|nr:hypothetical protein [Solirubrobacteraceae bacterium]MEA2429393.1 hypothetical protein [Thermoleophilaceae bacterium]